MERREVAFGVTTAGLKKTVTVLSAVSVDDIVRVSLKAYAYSTRNKIEYESPSNRGIRDMLVRVHTAQRSS